MIDDLVELLESEREWLAQQPNMQPWDAGCQRIVERIIDCLRRYSAELRDQVMNRESVDEREYVEKLWRCLGHHWRDAIRRAERQPDVEKPSLDEVTRQIASGQGYRGKGDLGGDPLRDVVLAVAMVRKDQQATRTRSSRGSDCASKVLARRNRVLPPVGVGGEPRMNTDEH